MESQMYGTPVLGANIGGIPELIQVGKTGELFESGNAEDLKKKIEKPGVIRSCVRSTVRTARTSASIPLMSITRKL